MSIIPTRFASQSFTRNIKRIFKFFVLVSGCAIYSLSWAEFEGDLVLYPKGCQNSKSGICKLDSTLRFKSADTLVWETDVWSSEKAKSGTTDGASIPEWAQGIIGDPYDEAYLKAAIVHDHYCYEENNVRTWRQTHRMFYDALIALKLSKIKALTMYFAVYLAGPHWVELVPGEYCGDSCIKNYGNSNEDVYFYENSLLNSQDYQKKITDLFEELSNGADLSVEDIETRAKKLDEDNFFFKNGNTYSPKGENDRNLMHRI